MNVETTERGFEVINFLDSNGEECSLQQSSAIGDLADSINKPGTSFLWLGLNKTANSFLPKSPRMHLSRGQVANLVQHLTSWLETGSLKEQG